MAIDIISKKTGNTFTKTVENGQKDVSRAKNFILECKGKDVGEGGVILIRSGPHFIRVDLAPPSKINLKDLATEIIAR